MFSYFLGNSGVFVELPIYVGWRWWVSGLIDSSWKPLCSSIEMYMKVEHCLGSMGEGGTCLFLYFFYWRVSPLSHWGWIEVPCQKDVEKNIYINILSSLQKRPQMALYRAKTGHLTWRSVTLSTRQKKGMHYFSKLQKAHEQSHLQLHSACEEVQWVWGQVLVAPMQFTCKLVFLLLPHFREAL